MKKIISYTAMLLMMFTLATLSTYTEFQSDNSTEVQFTQQKPLPSIIGSTYAQVVPIILGDCYSQPNCSRGGGAILARNVSFATCKVNLDIRKIKTGSIFRLGRICTEVEVPQRQQPPQPPGKF